MKILITERQLSIITENKLLPKYILFDIARHFNLNLNDEIKYLSSGSFGDAYKIGNKVIKITTDKREINSVKNIINKNINSIVKYYGYFKLNEKIYALLMDYVIPLEKYVKKNNGDEQFVMDVIETLVNNWGKIKNFEEYINLIDYEVKPTDFHHDILLKLYRFYKKIKQYKDNPDLHFGNLGIKNNELVMFDFNKL